MFLDNMRVRTKLYFGFGLVLLLLLVIGATSINVLNRIEQAQADNLKYETMGQFLLNKEIDHLNWTAALSDMFIMGRIFDKQLDPTKCSFGKWYYSFKVTDKQMTRSYQAIEEPHKRLHASAREIKELYLAGKIDEAKTVLHKKTMVALGEVRTNFHELGEIINGMMEQTQKNMNSIQSRANLIIWGVAILALILGVLISIFLGEKTARPLIGMVDMLKDIAEGEGDLTKRLQVAGTDEISEVARWFNLFLDKLSAMIIQITRSAEQVAAASEQMSASSDEVGRAMEGISVTIEGIASGSNQQNDELGSVNNRMSELNSSAQEVAASSQAASNATEKVSDNANEGGEAVNSAVDMMQEIKTSSADATNAINRLDEEAKKIGNIVNTITTIAEQTNLLALNAAIEAARAGEQGRGFAVVADEVRKLAENSASAAGEITNLVSGVQQSVKNAVELMNNGNVKVESGVEVVNRAGSAFKAIVSEIDNVTNQVQDISAAAEEQAASFGEVVQAASNIASIAQKSAADAENASASVEETAASAQELNSSAQALSKLALDLQDMVNRFKVDDEKRSATGLAVR